MSIITPEGILSFPQLFKPRAMNEKDDPRYSVTLVFRPEQLNDPDFQRFFQEYQASAAEAAKKKWPQGVPANLGAPFRRNTDRKVPPFTEFPQGMFISPWAKGDGAPPGVVDIMRNVLGEADVWSGQKARLAVNVFAYQESGNCGFSLGLQNVLITVRDAPRLDGRSRAEDDFSSFMNAPAPDPFSGFGMPGAAPAPAAPAPGYPQMPAGMPPAGFGAPVPGVPAAAPVPGIPGFQMPGQPQPGQPGYAAATPAPIPAGNPFNFPL